MSEPLHLVVGSTGAGKSTFAQRLASERGGLAFMIDDWMQRLYHPERPSDAGYDWYAPRIQRISELIWTLAERLARAGTPCVLEIGMTQRSARDAFYARAAQAGLTVQLHLLEAPASLRWQRVQARNHGRGATFALEVTRDMFDFVEQMWEPPSADELAAHAGERIDSSVPGRAG